MLYCKANNSALVDNSLYQYVETIQINQIKDLVIILPLSSPHVQRSCSPSGYLTYLGNLLCQNHIHVPRLSGLNSTKKSILGGLVNDANHQYRF